MQQVKQPITCPWRQRRYLPAFVTNLWRCDVDTRERILPLSTTTNTRDCLGCKSCTLQMFKLTFLLTSSDSALCTNLTKLNPRFVALYCITKHSEEICIHILKLLNFACCSCGRKTEKWNVFTTTTITITTECNTVNHYDKIYYVFETLTNK